MTLTEHISELRSRLGKALLAIAVATTAVAIWGYNPLIRMLEKPYRSVPADHRAVADGTLIFTHPTDAFVLRLKIALIAGLILSSPIWLYQLWAFVTPGLHRNERKWALAFVSTSVVLFTAGAVVAYLVLPKAMDVLLGVGGPGLAALLEATKYLSFVTSIMLIFGVSFEFPLLIIMLNFAGLLSSRRLRDWRRYAIFTHLCVRGGRHPDTGPVHHAGLGRADVPALRVRGTRGVAARPQGGHARGTVGARRAQ